MMAPQHLPVHQPHIGDGVGGYERVRLDEHSAAGDAMDAGGFDALGNDHGRQDRRQAPCQYRLPTPGDRAAVKQVGPNRKALQR